VEVFNGWDDLVTTNNEKPSRCTNAIEENSLSRFVKVRERKIPREDDVELIRRRERANVGLDEGDAFTKSRFDSEVTSCGGFERKLAKIGWKLTHAALLVDSGPRAREDRGIAIGRDDPHRDAECRSNDRDRVRLFAVRAACAPNLERLVLLASKLR